MVENKVLQLTEMSVNELKNLWRQYFDTEPVWKTKRFYIPRLAYRMQELRLLRIQISLMLLMAI